MGMASLTIAIGLRDGIRAFFLQCEDELSSGKGRSKGESPCTIFTQHDHLELITLKSIKANSKSFYSMTPSLTFSSPNAASEIRLAKLYDTLQV
jgi:hypothetical protein